MLTASLNIILYSIFSATAFLTVIYHMLSIYLGCKIFHLWHYVGSQRVSDFGALDFRYSD